MKKISKKISLVEQTKTVSFVLKNSYLLIIMLPLFVYFPSIKNGFVYCDDDILIIDNYSKLSNPYNIVKAFQTDAFFNNTSPYYRPLLNVSYIIDAQIANSSPGFYHFMNINYHILCCLSLFWLLCLLGFKKEISLAGTLLLSVHPLMANAVYWIPARNDLLVTLFSLIFLNMSILWIQNRKPILMIAAIFAFAMAIFSKESGIITPIVIILYLVLTKQLSIDKGKIIYFILLLTISIFWFILRSNAITLVSGSQVGPRFILTNYPFPFEIISKLFFPANIAVTPIYTPIYTGLGIILSILILTVFFKVKQKSTWLFFLGTVWYFAFSLPNMLVRLDTSANSYDYLPHRAYLPIIGLLIAIMSLLPPTFSLFNKKKTVVLFSIFLLYISLNSLYLSIKYSNPERFWNSSISNNPDKAWFYYFLGRYYYKQKDYTKFEKHLRKAISLNNHQRFLYDLGMIYFTYKKNYDTAIILFNQARATGFTDPEANSNYTRLFIESSQNYFAKGEYRKAADRCQIAVNLEPLNAIASFNLGLYLMYCNETEKAASLWRRSIILDPKLKESYRNLYFYYLNNTNKKDSVEYYKYEFINKGGSF